jgi:threonyl-tRNA synthetase
MNMKIRQAQMDKAPYMLIIGDKEMENASISVRLRDGQDLGQQKLSEFMSRVKALIESRDSKQL